MTVQFLVSGVALSGLVTRGMIGEPALKFFGRDDPLVRPAD